MTKLIDIERHLRAHGCILRREGSRHTVWRNPANGRQSTVPRHREVPLQTTRAICRQLGVPDVE